MGQGGQQVFESSISDPWLS